VDPDFTLGLGVAEALIVLGAVCSERLSRLLSIKPFHVLGVISYSIIMWHSLIITADLPIVFDGHGAPLVTHSLPQWSASPHVIPLVIVPAIIFWSMSSYICIERPFLMRRPRATISDGTVRADLQEAEVKRSA
jgi:peptidoglycan/LPS O-acetylase OafA/YrhL